MKSESVLATALLLIVVGSDRAPAGPVLQSSSASTDMGFVGVGPAAAINQSGLSLAYTSLVTDFDVYIAAGPTAGSNPSLGWLSATGVTTGNFDFDLGGSFTIESFVLWNWGNGASLNLNGFTLLADDNPAFSSPDTLGSFNATLPAVSSVPAEVFAFSPTQASYVRMQITSNYGSTDRTAFGEAAFEVSAAVPEPSGLALLGLGTAGLTACGWRRRRRGAVSRRTSIL